jgi:hypothetical protein
MHDDLLHRPILSPGAASRSASSTDCTYASVGLTCEETPAGFGLERLATAFMNNPD